MSRISTAAAAAAAIAGLALAGCGGGSKGSQTQNSVNALESAAEQSPPAAAEVLRNEADRLSGENIQVAPGDPNSPVQQAMNKAGNVQAAQESGMPPIQAAPHGAAKGNPPPKITPEQR